MKPVFALPLVALGVALAALTTGCATVDDKSAAEAKAPREYRTGSNIPVKDPSPPVTAEERERALEQIRSLQRTGNAGKPQS
ncbi:MAG: hypothetical protein ACXWCU_17735 [Caldimonas sp.]